MYYSANFWLQRTTGSVHLPQAILNILAFDEVLPGSNCSSQASTILLPNLSEQFLPQLFTLVLKLSKRSRRQVDNMGMQGLLAHYVDFTQGGTMFSLAI